MGFAKRYGTIEHSLGTRQIPESQLQSPQQEQSYDLRFVTLFAERGGFVRSTFQLLDRIIQAGKTSV